MFESLYSNKYVAKPIKICKKYFSVWYIVSIWSMIKSFEGSYPLYAGLQTLVYHPQIHMHQFNVKIMLKTIKKQSIFEILPKILGVFTKIGIE